MTTGTTACTSGTCFVIIPDTTVVYNFKIGLTAEMHDIGFFNAYYIPPEEDIVPEPEPGEETFYALDFDSSIFINNNEEKLIIIT